MQVAYISSVNITVACVHEGAALCYHTVRFQSRFGATWMEVIGPNLERMFDCWSGSSADRRIKQYQDIIPQVSRFQLADHPSRVGELAKVLLVWYTDDPLAIIYESNQAYRTCTSSLFPATVVAHGNIVYSVPKYLHNLFKLPNTTCIRELRKIVVARLCIQHQHPRCVLDLVNTISLMMGELFRTLDYLEYCSHNTVRRY